MVLTNEEYSSSKYRYIRSMECGVGIKRGLFKCVKANKMFNADLVGEYNILVDGKLIIPSPQEGIGVTGRKLDSGLNPFRGDAA